MQYHRIGLVTDQSTLEPYIPCGTWVSAEDIFSVRLVSGGGKTEVKKVCVWPLKQSVARHVDSRRVTVPLVSCAGTFYDQHLCTRHAKQEHLHSGARVIISGARRGRGKVAIQSKSTVEQHCNYSHCLVIIHIYIYKIYIKNKKILGEIIKRKDL